MSLSSLAWGGVVDDIVSVNASAASFGTYNFSADCSVPGQCVSPLSFSLVVVDTSFTALSPTSVTIDPGASTVLRVSYLRDGDDGPGVTWSPIPEVVPDPTSPGPATGEFRATFSSSTPGTYLVDATPDCARGLALCPTNIITFTITVVNRDISGGTTVDALPGKSVTLTANTSDDGIGVDGKTVSWIRTAGLASPANATSVSAGGGFATLAVTVDPGAPVGSNITYTAERTDNPGELTTFTIHVVAPTLTVVSGNGQDGVASSTADLPLVVQLTGVGGVPLANESITWSVLSGPAVVLSPNTTTGPDGKAQTTFKFGASAGAITIQASAFSGLATANFSATSLRADMAGVQGNGQSGPISTRLPIDFKVRISEPAAISFRGNGSSLKGLSGVPIVWTVTGGGGSLTVTNGNTDSAGEASTSLTLGPSRGVNTVTASIPGGASVTFTATAFLPVGTLTIVSGNNQTLPTNTESAPLLVRLTDPATNLPVDGITVNWTASNAQLTASTCITNTQGQCSVSAEVVLPGNASVSATTTQPNAGPATFSLNGGVAELPNLTPEQRAIAEAIDNLCPALAALSGRNADQNDLLARCREIVDAAGLDPDAAIDALDALFPDVALVQATAALQAAQAQFDNLKARIAALRSGTGGDSFGGLALAGPGGTIPLASFFSAFTQDGEAGAGGEVGSDFSRWGFFASGTLGRGESDPGSINPAYDFDINGITLGVDYRQSDKWIWGAALGYTRQDTELTGNIGSLDTSGWSLSGYTTYYQENSWYVDGVLTWGQNSYDLVRTIRYTLPLPGGGTSVIDQVAQSSSDGGMLSAAATFGRDFQKGGWSFGPYGRLTYTRLSFDRSTESLQSENGVGLGLVIETRDVTSLAGVIGGKMTYTHSAEWGIVMPHFQFEWEREFKDDPATIEARFLNDPTATPIVVTADPLDTSYFRIGLGLSLVLTKGRSGFFLYERMLGRDGFEQDNFALGFRMEF